jgi:hypothetical protein
MKSNVITFPRKLYNMLETVSEDNEQDAPVAWLPRGNGFVILDEQAFLEKIIPVHFSLTQMRSFTRQLNLWGFNRYVICHLQVEFYNLSPIFMYI